VLKIVGATSTFGTPRWAGRRSVRRADVERLNDRERQNATRKRLLADAELDRLSARVSQRPRRRLGSQS
jgi:hypothetical protein